MRQFRAAFGRVLASVDVIQAANFCSIVTFIHFVYDSEQSFRLMTCSIG